MDRPKNRDNRENSRYDDISRGSDRRSYEKRSTQKSRSRSRDRKRDRDGRRASRSRSHDRKRDRADKGDEYQEKNDRSRKSHRSDGGRDQNGKKTNHSKSDDKSKTSSYEVVEDYDDSSLKEIEDFITEENVDEVQEAERLALERKLRREQILQKYNAEKTVSAPTAVHLSQSIVNKSTTIIEQNIAAITGGTVDTSLQTSTANSLAALVIAENKLTPDHNSGDQNFAEVTNISEQLIVTDLAPGMNGDTILEIDNIEKTLSAEDSSELINDVVKVVESSLTATVISSTSNENLDADEPSVDQTDGEPMGAESKFLAEAEERQAEKSALRLDAHNHKESQPFDMFSSSPSDVERGVGKDVGSKAWQGKRALREALLEGEDPHLQSNWDDGDGYYKPRIGELIGEQYQTMGIVGKGVFSIVIKCVDLRVKDGLPVAIKVIRNNDTMRKAAEKERSILCMIKDRDPENRRHCVRLLAHFEFRNHVALVFDYQQMNLRETLKKFGKDVGINIGAVRMYARQLLVALRHIADLRVVHADIKLDNILCSGDLKQVKLCDFGSAFRETDTDNDPTPYLVSRFYRAPEIILGLTYDRAIDLWSVAVCLFELFTGHVMFPGRTNNEMLRLMMAVKGRIANKQLKSHFRAYEAMQLDAHFDERDLKFKQMELDPVTGKNVQRLVDITQPSKDLASVIRGSKAGSDDGRLVSSLSDLLDKCLGLDPLKRISVSDALKHPFFALQ